MCENLLKMLRNADAGEDHYERQCPVNDLKMKGAHRTFCTSGSVSSETLKSLQSSGLTFRSTVLDSVKQ